jgi:hypothetical protein
VEFARRPKLFVQEKRSLQQGQIVAEILAFLSSTENQLFLSWRQTMSADPWQAV